MDYGAAWALIENMLLAATAEGLGSVVHIPVKKEPEKINEYVNAKYNYYLPAMVILGYAKEGAQTSKQVEATVEKKAHWNKW
jgi:nitroreductase